MTIHIPAWVNGSLKPIEKLEVHKKGLRHKAVSVFIMDGENVLLQRRAMHKYHTPGLWANTCCTHPAWEEPPADCAVRRLKEELGIGGVYPSHRDQVEYRADVGGGMIEHEVVDIYMAMATRTLKIAPNPDEVMQVEWVGFYDLTAEIARRPERFTPWLRIYLQEHRDRIFGALMKV
ncbi:isopentenyl-diphosphate Delta-isomerase [Actibacterium sp. 188UL27-1]|uniref:isopentenyl-diphosphate Delta-isomerase n=1 Tax=Actibacterium sp. 188UL27-1 TaxID=2786961 RepID=UPI00195A8784|nr:isopentenyl-diphosphate Delta-isomerase [Actibacterium sp. 188UL27-1]MBM7068612.1 isopentenyl-diphosphate Delta-isomerase [Actibacterium sp. 188UL27-1]